MNDNTICCKLCKKELENTACTPSNFGRVHDKCLKGLIAYVDANLIQIITSPLFLAQAEQK